MSPDGDRQVLLGHGSGGTLTAELIQELFLAELDNPILARLDDAGVAGAPNGRLAVTTDGFVVSPRRFPGGDLGSLAVHGTLNDLAVAGAKPLYLTLAAILEEGLPLAELRHMVRSAAKAAKLAEVHVIAGDTKVVERGKGDGAFLITTGVGVMREGYPRLDRGPADGDAILLSGPVGDHGAVILAARHGIDVGSALQSDSAPVLVLVEALFRQGIVPSFMRDPTRGGLAGVLCDLAEGTGLSVEVREGSLPVRRQTVAVCDLTGVDPLHLACEGRVVAVVEGCQAERALTAWRELPSGRQAAVVGCLSSSPARQVVLETGYGSRRVLLRPSAELLPRIC